MKKIITLATASLLVATFTLSAQKSGKVPAYKPVKGLQKEALAPVIFSSLKNLNDKKLKVSGSGLKFEKTDLEKMVFETNEINYFSMLMKRRARAQYTFKGGALHIKLVDMEVQNQTAGGTWEESKLMLKGDKKLLALLADNINKIKADPAAVRKANSDYYGNAANLGSMLANSTVEEQQVLKGVLSESVDEFGGPLTVVDVNFTEEHGSKYAIEYRYGAKSAGGVKFIQYTNSDDALALSKNQGVGSVAGFELIDMTKEQLLFKSESVTKKSASYDYKKLVDTDPIEGVSFDDAFPLIYAALEAEGVKVHKMNRVGRFITTDWVDIQDGKKSLHALLTFFYDEGKIWPYYTQIMNSRNRNTSCKTDACTQLKQKLSESISSMATTGDISAIRSAFYSNESLNAMITADKGLTSANLKLWEDLKASGK